MPLLYAVGVWLVSVLTEPPWSTPSAPGLYQAPCGIERTPGTMRGVTYAGSLTWPRSFQTVTMSPLAIPRFFASIVLIHTC